MLVLMLVRIKMSIMAQKLQYDPVCRVVNCGVQHPGVDLSCANVGVAEQLADDLDRRTSRELQDGVAVAQAVHGDVARHSGSDKVLLQGGVKPATPRHPPEHPARPSCPEQGHCLRRDPFPAPPLDLWLPVLYIYVAVGILDDL